MIDGDGDVDFGNLHNPHDLVAVQVQAGHILLIPPGGLGDREGIRKDHRLQAFVVGPRPLPFRFVVDVFPLLLLRDGFVVA